MNNKIKIIIIDDHPLVRQGMKKVIEKEADLVVINEAGNAEEALKAINSEEPHLAIVDISLDSATSGIDLVKALTERFSAIKSLVLSMHDENIYAERALKAGARGYLTKKEAPSVIIEAIRAIMGGELYLSKKISTKIIDRIITGKGGQDESPANVLSDRELEIFNMIGNGLSTGDIARKLNISVNTVESHRKKIKDKLGIQKGSELMKAAVQWVITSNK